MEIWHRIHIDGKHAGYWQSLGVTMKPILSALDTEGRPKSWVADVCEDSNLWPELKTYVGSEPHFVNTFFTDQERLSAEWCILRGCGIVRPNQPLGGYWNPTYYEGKCKICGSGWTQSVPFHLSKEPKLGKNALASFGSAFELFGRNEVFERFEAEKIRGTRSWPVWFRTDGRASQSVKQLLIDTIAEPAIADELAEHEHYHWTDCNGCGRRWHIFYSRGMLPLRRSGLKRDVDFQMTHEWFGSGRAARREILVSNRVVRLILANHWKGADLSPVQVV